MRLLNFIFPAVLAALLLAGCSPEKVLYPHTLENKDLSKKIDADLTLERGQKRLDYVSGKSGQSMHFLLKNVGLAPVKIDEWYMDETENIRVRYAVCEKGKSAEITENQWQEIWPWGEAKNRKHGRHMPAMLNPGTGILIKVPFDFLKTFPMNGKPVVNIALYAELSLQSVSAKTPVYEIEIRPIVVEIK